VLRLISDQICDDGTIDHLRGAVRDENEGEAKRMTRLKTIGGRERVEIHVIDRLLKVVQEVILAGGTITDIQSQPRSYVQGEASRVGKGVSSRMHQTYIRRAIDRRGVKTVCDRQGKSWRRCL
jgi:hypothetical protein